MKKSTKIIFLTILPIFFLLSTLAFKGFKGELFLNNYYDPSYAYLLNSLNLSQLESLGVGHIDHPGTTVQTIGAISIYFTYQIAGEATGIVADVFNRSEYYLSQINFVINSLNSLAIFFLGLIALYRLKSLSSAIFLQLTPFFSVPVYYNIMNVSPEPLLIFSVLILLCVIISYYFQEGPKNLYLHAALFGVVCAFGLVTKITFFPLILIPLLIIEKVQFKILFLFFTFLTVILFFYPALSTDHIQYFKNWIRKLILFSGKYGSGDKNVVDFSDFVKNMVTIFYKEPLFGVSYFISLFTLGACFIRKIKNKNKSCKSLHLLLSVFFSMTIQIIIVSKHFELHYLIPGFLLSIFSIYLSFKELKEISLFQKKKMVYLYKVIIGIIMIIQINSLFELRNILTNRRDESHKILENVNLDANKMLKINSYGVSSQEFALFMGSLFSGSQKKYYYSVLSDRYSQNFFWDVSSKILHNTLDSNNIKAKLNNSKSVFFLCDNVETLNNFIVFLKQYIQKEIISTKKVFINTNGESIYEINIDNR